MSDPIRDPEAVLAALERAKDDAKKNREQLDAVRAELDATKAQMQEYSNSLKDEWLKQAIRNAGADPERVSRYISTDAITIEKDGLRGFEEEFNRVKNELPELFDVKRRVGGAVDMFPEDQSKVSKSTSELQAERLLNSR